MFRPTHTIGPRMYIRAFVIGTELAWVWRNLLRRIVGWTPVLFLLKSGLEKYFLILCKTRTMW